MIYVRKDTPKTTVPDTPPNPLSFLEQMQYGGVYFPNGPTSDSLVLFPLIYFKYGYRVFCFASNLPNFIKPIHSYQLKNVVPFDAFLGVF